jgi:hypothetical protein
MIILPERKSVEPIALNVGDGQVFALQKFINIAPWGHDDVQTEIHQVFVEELVPTAIDTRVGVVGVIDESGFSRKGNHSAGEGRQHNGRLGEEDNSRSGSSWSVSLPAARRCWIISSSCPSRGAKTPWRARIGERRFTSPRRSASRPSPGSLRDWSGRWPPWAWSTWTGSSPTSCTDATASSSTSWNAGATLPGRGPGEHDGLDQGPGLVRAAVRRSGPGADPRGGRFGGQGRLVAEARPVLKQA